MTKSGDREGVGIIANVVATFPEIPLFGDLVTMNGVIVRIIAIRGVLFLRDSTLTHYEPPHSVSGISPRFTSLVHFAK